MATRLFSCLAILVLLAACSGRQPEGPPAINATLEEGALPNAVVAVRVENLRPGMRVEEVRLAGPDGRRVAALPESYRTLRGQEAVSRRPTVGVGVQGGSSDGIQPSLSLALPLLDWSWARREDRTLNAVAARIPVPEGYRDEPEAWRVEAEITDVSGTTRTFRAPAPG
jgi:hypothetical protein